jgi:hypothetical protein
MLLRFSPTDAAFGKNPGQLPPLTVPHFADPEFDGFLAHVIQRTKDRLNELSEEQREAQAEQEWFRATLPSIGVADEVNGLIERAKVGGDVCRHLLHARAIEIGLKPNKATGLYEAPVPEQVKEAA